MRRSAVQRLCDSARKPLAAADALVNRFYGWRHNPLYQSGSLVVVAFVVMLVTGVYLLLFYRIGAPYESVVRIESQAWAGSWIRALHRYAADLAVIAVLLHAYRMFVQGRSWGARTRAWVSGAVLLFFAFVSGWTGYVMIWDDFGQLLAIEGARLMDALPIFGEPIGRAFVGERELPGAFFFLNLFAHIAVPVGMALVLWIHVSRLARPVLLPPRGLLWGVTALLFALSVLVPAPLGPPASAFTLPGSVAMDWFYAFWLPATRALPAPAAWAVFGAVTLVLVLVPWWSRPPASERPPPSVANPRLCTGCFQCSLDCPFEAISMVEHEGAHADRVASIDPSICVSCGICAGSCAPMAVGPPLRTGREQIARVGPFVGERRLGPEDLVVVACRNGAGHVAEEEQVDGASVFAVSCAGSVHSSVIEYFLRSGVGGVLVASCPPRDCRQREGPKWTVERLHHGREAELREQLDRSRLAVVHAGEAERGRVLEALAALRARAAELDRASAEETIDLERECEPPLEEVAS